MLHPTCMVHYKRGLTWMCKRFHHFITWDTMLNWHGSQILKCNYLIWMKFWLGIYLDPLKIYTRE